MQFQFTKDYGKVFKSGDVINADQLGAKESEALLADGTIVQFPVEAKTKTTPDASTQEEAPSDTESKDTSVESTTDTEENTDKPVSKSKKSK